MSKFFKSTKAFYIILFLAILCIIFYFKLKSPLGELNVLNWDYYIGETTISDFQKEYNIKVNYKLYKTNEACLVELKSNPKTFDIAFPSDYMIEILINQGMLFKIDKGKLSNLKNLGSNFKGKYYFDPNLEYSVPYMFGTTGFAINTSNMEHSSLSWKSLSDKSYKGKIAIMDDMRFVLGSVLLELNYDPNTTNEDELNEAVEILRKVRPNVVAFTSDSPKNLLLSGRVSIAYGWSGDILQVQKLNPEIRYYIPKYGTLKFQDGIVIPIDAPNRDVAHKFIDFILRADVSSSITNHIFYGNPNLAAKSFIKKEIVNNPVSFPTEAVSKKLYYIKDLGEYNKLYEKAWEKVKL